MGVDPVKNGPKLKLKKAPTIVSPLDIVSYFKTLAQLKPSAVVVPLDDNVFNTSKSNVAMIEANMSGAICYSNFGHEFARAQSLDKLGQGTQDIWKEQSAGTPLLNDTAKQRVELLTELFIKKN